MNCHKHPEMPATHWRKGLTKGNDRVYMCLSCANSARHVGLLIHKLEPPAEHCPDCGNRTGGGTCMRCQEQLQEDHEKAYGHLS